MSTSQNGWPIYTDGRHPDLVAIPHVAGRVRRGDVATIFNHLISRFDREVEPVAEGAGQPEDDWGWANRPILDSPEISNHASGTAVDLNAPRHPIGASGTFSAAQMRSLRPILDELIPVVRWGGDFAARKDEMHFEIVGTPEQVAAVAARLRGGGSVAQPTPPTSEEDDMTPAQAAQLARIDALLSVPGQPYGLPEAILNAVRATEERVKGVRGVLDVPGMPFAYPAATHVAVGGLVSQVAALQVAVRALAAGTGAEPDAILTAAREGAQQALDSVTASFGADEAR